jgi:hypothetical protein
MGFAYMEAVAILELGRSCYTISAASQISSSFSTRSPTCSLKNVVCRLDIAGNTGKSSTFIWGIWGACGSQCQLFVSQYSLTNLKYSPSLLCKPALSPWTMGMYPAKCPHGRTDSSTCGKIKSQNKLSRGILGFSQLRHRFLSLHTQQGTHLPRF